MMKRQKFICTVAMVGLLVGSLQAAPSEHFKVFLCFGQSNISGGAGVSPGTNEMQTTPRVMALAFNTCGTPSWQKDTWVSAREPLHCGDNGAGNSTMGPCYVFGKIMADSLPNDTIGLIPCGQSGVNIEAFMPDGKCTAGYCVPYPNQSNTAGATYNWMLKRCQDAIKRGVFTGIFLHQGESNKDDGNAWLTKVKTIYDDLKRDIPLAKDVPIIAGQLLDLSKNQTFNNTVKNMSTTFTYGSYASSTGLQGGGQYTDLHFNQDGYRTLAQRYAVEMMKELRITTGIQTQPQRVVSAASIKSQRDNIKVYSLNGRFVSTGAAMSKAKSFKSGNVYVVANKTNNASLKLMIAPTTR